MSIGVLSSEPRLTESNSFRRRPEEVRES